MNTQVPPSAFFLPAPSSENNGVDFLGLRQANLDMMAALIPGTNNVTSYIRPFSLLSWIFWKFHGLCEEAGKEKPTSDEMREFRERIEVLYTWGCGWRIHRVSPASRQSRLQAAKQCRLPSRLGDECKAVPV